MTQHVDVETARALRDAGLVWTPEYDDLVIWERRLSMGGVVVVVLFLIAIPLVFFVWRLAS